MKAAIHLVKGVLDKLPLLEGVSQEAVRELATQSSVVRTARGQVIVHRGERVPSLYAVAFGTVKTRLPRPSGSEVVLGLLGAGATFGKTSVMLDLPSQVDVVALDDTMLVAIRGACVLALVERNLRFSRNLARALAERNQALMSELESGKLRSAQRLAAYLDSIAEPAAEPGLLAARLAVSKTLLAARLGIKKETLSRLLREFARDGLIEVAGRTIAIRDAGGLRQVAGSAGGLARAFDLDQRAPCRSCDTWSVSQNPCARVARELALFRGVNERRIGVATRDARLVSLRSGDALVRRGAPLPGLCALAAGSLKLSVSARPRDERVLGLVAPGESFGEAAALRASPAPFDAVAVSDAQVLAIPVEAIQLLLRRDTAFARNLLDRLAGEILRLLAGIEAGMLQRAPQRLASYLCTLAGSDGASPRRVSLPVSKTVVAAMLGVKKETLSRLLRDLSERRLIAVSRRDITILDRARLEGVR